MFVTKSLKYLPTAFKNNCVAHFTTFSNRKKIFFNRKRELTEFMKVFNYEVPRIHVILGPPSTGKTSLVNEVMSRGDFNPLFIDCRGGSFNTSTNLYNSLAEQFYSFFERTKSNLSEISAGTSANIQPNQALLLSTLSADVHIKFKAIEKTAKNIVELLNIIHKYLPSRSFWKKQNIPPPILIIDEVNKFSQLCNSDEGIVILESFLDWLVKNTKQDENFHVVLTTSDSFFLNWITKMLHIPHVTPYVVGDLSRKEAEEFFDKHVLPQHEAKICKELEGKFDHICNITGTRMLIINQYVDEYEIHKGNFKKFSVYKQEYDWLGYGLYPETLNNLLKKSYAPLWSKSDFIKTMESIIKSPEFILEHDLIQLIGKSKVNSLIKYNFLHRRPTNNFANDIINPPEKVILTTMNKLSVHAMKNILKEIS